MSSTQRWIRVAVAAALPLVGIRAVAASADSDSGALEEVVVTAQFREQRLQDTPISISAFSADALEARSAGDIAAAANAVPNVNISKGALGFGQTAAVFIRGIGQSDPHFAVEPGVGMYIDDVYYGVMTGSVFGLLDMDRVEVLRGPQGTLAGKNSIGGSVKLFTKRPGPERDAYVEGTFGGRNLIGGRGATNITLVPDHLYLRAAVASRRSDGYVTRLDYDCAKGGSGIGTSRVRPDCKIGTEGGEEVLTARAALRWIVNDAFEDQFIVDSTQDRSENPASKLLFQSSSWAGTANFLTPPESYSNYENYISRPQESGLRLFLQSLAPPGVKVGNPPGPAYPMPQGTPLDATGLTNLIKWRLSDHLQLDAITGYRKSDVQFSTAGDGSPYSINDQIWRLQHEQFTQELRLSGTLGTLLDWTVGAFYYDADGVSSLRVTIPGGTVVGGGDFVALDLLATDPVKTTSKSAFLHTVWHLAEGLNATAAVRYTSDKKSYTFNRWDDHLESHWLLLGLQDLTRTYKGNNTDFRLGVDYRWTDEFMTYAQVSTGYKGGGVNPRPYYVGQAIPYDPEKLRAYEIGAKTQFFDRRLTLNGSVFYNEYSAFQGTIYSCPAFTPGNALSPCAMTTNIGDAEIKGVELEVQAEPIDGFRVDASVGKLQFKYTRVNPTSGLSLGFKNVYSPDMNLSVGAQYTISAGTYGSLTPRVDYSYHSAYFTDADNSKPLNEIGAQGLVNARLTWKGPDEEWEAALAVTNLTDQFYYVSKFASTTAPYFDGTGRPGEPRQWMVTIKRQFN
ncbi:MAG: TonB-dependent receptor [Pseudomonadota bacterium]